jgi:hypothetical protein
MLAGASDAAVTDAFNDAKTLLETYTPAEIADLKGKNGKDLTQQFTDLGSALDEYNNGLTGPGHCGDEYEEAAEKSARINVGNNIVEFNGATVYPNPVTGNATISFKPAYDGNATVELYNLMGQKSNVLFNRDVVRNIPVTLSFDAQQYTGGMYFVIIQNGPARESTKIEIRR